MKRSLSLCAGGVILVLAAIAARPATALSMSECRAKYKAALAAKTHFSTLFEFQRTQCGIDPKAHAGRKAPRSGHH